MDIEKRVMDLEREQVAADEQRKTLFRRVGNLESEQKAMQSFAVSLEKLANAVGNTEKKVDNLCKKVEAIEAKPGKRWETFGMELGKILLAAVAGLVLAKMGIV